VSTHVRTSACVDCATPIIGPQLRCAACHADHAEAIDRLPATPKSPLAFGRVVLVWMVLVLVEVIAIAICGVLLVMKECV
jgi:hypothetical protein